jgi:hypothetical protein
MIQGRDKEPGTRDRSKSETSNDRRGGEGRVKQDTSK